jgi:hypothetical protein
MNGKMIVLMSSIVFFDSLLFLVAEIGSPCAPSSVLGSPQMHKVRPGPGLPYYTLPMEIGLYATPGIDILRSTSFYGRSFVHVTFKYGVDYYFSFSQPSVAMRQNRRARSYDPSEQLHGRNLSLSGGGPAAFWNHQSTHGAGWNFAAIHCSPHSDRSCARPQPACCSLTESPNIFLSEPPY